MRQFALYHVAALAMLLTLSMSAGAASLADELAGLTNATVRVEEHPATGNVAFLRIDGPVGLARPYAGVSPTNAAATAQAFLQQFGGHFGLANPGADLRLLNAREQRAGRSRHVVRFEQRRAGLPVFGGELVVRLDESLRVTGVNGAISSAPGSRRQSINTRDAAATASAVAARANADVEASSLSTSAPVRKIFNPSLMGLGANREHLALEFVVSDDRGQLSHTVLIDAATGAVLLDFTNLQPVLDRVVHDLGNDYLAVAGPVNRVRSEGDGPTGDTDVDLAYDYAGDTYDFYWNRHGRDSIDDAGMQLVSAVRYCSGPSPCPEPNAYWDGAKMLYGEGFVLDDVVAHELTHGVTSATSRLVYAYQSGAINESLSDIWGEFVDLTNGAGSDQSADRWLLGEELPGIGAIRSLADPTLFGDPDRMSSANYHCLASDSGGVHSNSGVNNKAAQLMVDGGVFNGSTVASIGIDKTAALYYQAQTNYLTPLSSFRDLYYSLLDSCSDLVGGPDGMTASDCNAVRDALDSVEMSQGNSCVSGPMPALCGAGQIPQDTYLADFESGTLAGWIVDNIQAGGDFTVRSDDPASGTYHLHGTNPSFVTQTRVSQTTPVIIPPDARLAFDHISGLEYQYDGGMVEFDLGTGAGWQDAGVIFPLVAGAGYDLVLYPSNPAYPRPAFSGKQAYRRTILDLASVAGESMTLGFLVSTDGVVGWPGWTIDDVRVYTCDTPIALYCNGKPVTVNIGLGNVPTPGDDVILGTEGNDVIKALGGNDTICGLGGIDEIYGQGGDDDIFGGDDDDDLYGGTGNDFIDGEGGADELFGQGGNDELHGGAGDGAYDYFYGGSGSEDIFMEDGGGYVSAGGNNDTVVGTPQADIIYGNTGLDTIHGEGGDDELHGGLARDTIHGGPGEDVIFGEGHNDFLYGDADNDTIYGGTGNDTMDGGADTDSCIGQGGTADKAIDCESTTTVPFVPSLLPPDVIPEEDVNRLDRCDLTRAECLAAN